MTPLTRIALVSALVLAPVLASAATVNPYSPYIQNTTSGYSMGFVSNSGGFSTGLCSAGIGCIASTILYLINSVLVPTLFAVAFMVFLYGITKTYIFSHGETAEVEQGHKLILWGLIGFVVMVSLWGLVNVVANTFGLQGVGAPTLPTSYYTPQTQ